jgi:hypothetical protein
MTVWIGVDRQRRRKHTVDGLKPQRQHAVVVLGDQGFERIVSLSVFDQRSQLRRKRTTKNDQDRAARINAPMEL